MHERDLEPEHPVTRPDVDQLNALLRKVRERSLDIGDLVSDVVHPFAALREEAADRSVVTERCKQLDPAVADPHRRRFDSLLLDALAMLQPTPEEPFVRRHGGVQIRDRDADVVNGPWLHRRDATAAYGIIALMGRRLAVALLVLLAVAGCGGGTKSNGEAKKTAEQVVADAQKAAVDATIVHVVGQGTDNGSPLKIDLWVGNAKGKGHLEENGLGFDIVRVGDVVYIKGGSAFLKKFANAGAAALLHDKWLKGPATSGQLASLASLTDKKQFFKGVLGQHGKVENKGETDYHGTKAVEIKDTTQGGSLFVAATGAPYPVALEGGKEQGSITFADWDGDEAIEAPKGAVDLSSLGK
jgi:hypothetical protein